MGLSMIKPSLLICVLATTLVGNSQTLRPKNPAAIAKEANGAVVLIVMSDKEGHPVAQGSGFLVSKDGRVVTNYHVIKSGSSAIIKLPNGAFFPVDGVIVSDKDRDVAIIKANGSDFRMLILGDSDRLQVGEEVVAIGSPLSLESTVSNGIVSGMRTVKEEGGKLLQTTAPISPGSSGGPLFNTAGEVVGITTSHLKGGENLNFAIPINDVKPMLLTEPSKPHSLPDEAENDTTASGQQADLKTTIDFMKKMVVGDSKLIGYQVKQDKGVVHFDYAEDATASCDIAIAVTARRLALIVDGTAADEYGNLEFTFTVFQEPPVWQVSLKQIDPSSISSLLVPSREYVARMYKTHGRMLPSDLSNSDLTLVKGKDTDGSMKNAVFLLFQSQDRAERFVTAMKHAVKLCGGTESEFPPTPTK